MDKTNSQLDTAAADDACYPNVVAETKPGAQCSLLRLPPELRLIIYHSLFSNLKVTIHRQASSKHADFCAIMRTCRLCYAESISAFFESVIVTLKHEAFLYVLKRRIGLHNMVRIRSLLVGGFESGIGGSLALQVPDSLENLYIKWKGNTDSFSDKPLGRVPDSHVRYLLDNNQRYPLTPCVKKLWTRNPKLRIWLAAVFGTPRPDKVCPNSLIRQVD